MATQQRSDPLSQLTAKQYLETSQADTSPQEYHTYYTVVKYCTPSYDSCCIPTFIHIRPYRKGVRLFTLLIFAKYTFSHSIVVF